MFIRRALPTLALLTAAALVLTACGGDTADTGGDAAGDAPAGPLREVTLTLNFLAAGPNSGFMLAKENGYYEEAGLDVTIQEGQGSGTTASLVSTGNSDFGYADAPATMAVRAKGGTLKIVAPVLQTNGFAVMSLKESGITTLDGLRGKTLAVQPGTAQAALLGALLQANGIAENEVNVVNIDPSALVGSLLQKQVDAIAGGADAQGIQIVEQGAELNQILYGESGVPTVGLSMIANESLLASDPEVVKSFVEASLRGWDEARKNPEAAGDAVAEQFPQAGDAETFVTQLNVDIPLMCTEGAATMGNVPDANWTTTFDLLTRYQELPTEKPVTDYYTTDFLPEAPPAC